MKKKVSSRTFLSHPAGLPETELFLWTASGQYYYYTNVYSFPLIKVECQLVLRHHLMLPRPASCLPREDLRRPGGESLLR